MKKLLTMAALTLFSAMGLHAQLLTTTVEQGEIEGVEHEGFALYKNIPYASHGKAFIRPTDGAIGRHSPSTPTKTGLTWA